MAESVPPVAVAPPPKVPAGANTAATSLPPPKTASPAPAVTSDSRQVPPKPSKGPEVEVASPPAGGAAASSEQNSTQKYFEVGKFKDRSWALKTTDQLAQLGFHTTVVQKGRLWTSSYRVLVGPFGDESGAKAAQDNLLSRGFKPRTFERGSRTVTFISGQSLNGGHIEIGECEISWESYLKDAAVKFTQGRSVVASADGKWVPRDGRYKRDAYVYRKNGDGSRTLIEIRFEGMNQALVF